MKSGYKVFWTEHAISELEETIEYLKTNWSERELRIFSAKLDHTIELISKLPEMFPESFEKKVLGKQSWKKTIVCIIEFIRILLRYFHYFQAKSTLQRRKYKKTVA